MAKRTPKNRFKVSDSFVHSCKAFVTKDIDSAFLWAIKVLDQTNSLNLHLTENEQHYINEVLKRKKRKDSRN